LQDEQSLASLAGLKEPGLQSSQAKRAWLTMQALKATRQPGLQDEQSLARLASQKRARHKPPGCKTSKAWLVLPARKEPGLQSHHEASLASPARQAKPAWHKAHQACLASHARLKSQSGWM